jgi:hypothetical protein
MGGHYSPCDPLFFLHHAYYDYVWYKWQRRVPANFNAYGGQNWNHARTGKINAASTDYLPPIPWLAGTTRVSDVFSTNSISNRFCNSYLPYSNFKKRAELQNNTASGLPPLPPMPTLPANVTEGTGQTAPEFEVEDENNTKVHKDPQIRREFAAANLNQPLPDALPLPDYWIKMNGLDPEVSKQVLAKIKNENKEINAIWKRQRGLDKPNSLGMTDEASVGVRWPLWSIVVTAVGCVAIVAVIIGVIVVIRVLKRPPESTNDKFTDVQRVLVGQHN